MTEFAKWLKEARTKRGLTQAQLAKSLGVTHTYISHLEHGRFLAKRETLTTRSALFIDAMAQALGVPCEEARRAAQNRPLGPLQSSPISPAVMDMILRLPLQVQEDLKVHIETLYSKHCGSDDNQFVSVAK